MPNLPAPYVSPWREFGRNLRALGADLGLRIRELWRRNREGDLSVPAFWPRDLAPLFWPLLLVLLLALPVAGLRWLLGSTAMPATESSSQQPSFEAAPSLNLSGELSRVEGSRVTDLPLDDAVSSLADQALPPAPEPERQREFERPAPRELQLDPLLALMIEGDSPDDLLRAAEPDLQANRLLMRVTPSAWVGLTAAARQQQAETWLATAEDLGYATLWLVDDQDRPLARSARVGDGMILFDVEAP